MKSIIYMGIVILVSIVSIFILVNILTQGNFTEWFSSTFGVGGYQNWYYKSSKSFYITDVDVSFLMLVQASIVVVYLVKLYQFKGRKSAIFRYGLLAFANMAAFCAVNEYKLLSGNTIYEVALTVLFFTCLYEVICFLYNMSEMRTAVTTHAASVLLIASIVTGVSYIISEAKEELVFWKMTDKTGVYVEQLGGNLNDRYEDVARASVFLNGEDFFATYASAQEVVEGTYQPSGVDYIIHVLGDRQREDYLESFLKKDFKYAATLNRAFSGWEYWAERANWFFYRELYRNWHPVYANTYELYWEENEKNKARIVTDDFDISIVPVDETTQKLVIRTDESIDGIADIWIDYSVEKKDNKSAKLMFQKMLQVNNTGKKYVYLDFGEDINYELYYLRAESDEYIPMMIVDGYGELTLTSCPSRSTYLSINDVSCETIYPVVFDYVEASDIVDSGDRTVINVPMSHKNKESLEWAKAVEIGGKHYLIEQIGYDDTIKIIVNNEGTPIDPEGDLLSSGNMIKLVKE